jgi:hypothetical protein
MKNLKTIEELIKNYDKKEIICQYYIHTTGSTASLFGFRMYHTFKQNLEEIITNFDAITEKEYLKIITKCDRSETKYFKQYNINPKLFNKIPKHTKKRIYEPQVTVI